MTVTAEHTAVIRPAALTAEGRTVTRTIPGVGTLVFEDFPAGGWMTKAGEPAKTARRRYLLDGVELDSVSNIVGTFDKPALVRWIERQATVGAVQAERLGELAGVPERDWAYRVRSLGLGASAQRDEGADRGKAIHAAFHRLAVDGRVPNPMEFDGVARPWVQGAMRAWLALNPGDTILAEQPVCHPELGYAGTPDLVATIAERTTLLDYKTSRNGRIFEQAHYQTRLYALALAECGITVDHILIIGVGDDGTYEIVECAATNDDARHLVAVYRARKRVLSSMADQRRTAKAAA